MTTTTRAQSPLPFSTAVAAHRGTRGTRGFTIAPARHLTGPQPEGLGRYILIARDLTPADTAALDLDQVAGFCTSDGGPTSHAVQVAYSLGIPTVVAAGPPVLTVAPGTMCALDGDTGTLYSGLSEPADLAIATDHLDSRLARPPMRDGIGAEPVTLTGTIARPSQAVCLREAGADGLGLLATELLFLGREQDLLDEEAHYRAYREIARDVEGATVTLRTLDIGGDKDIPALGLPHEDNPFLGVRGLRLGLRRPDLLQPQLRAAYRVARDDGARLRLMFPMVTSVEEFRQAAATARRIQAELNAPDLPLGVMVEVPACALTIDRFAGHIDFLSIGTNDLAQYLTAMSRTSAALAEDIDPLHISVTRTVRMVAQTGADHGIPVSACGGLAGDPVGAVVLAALGVTSLTVALPYLPEVRDALARTTPDTLAAIRTQALDTGGGDHLRDLVCELLCL